MGTGLLATYNKLKESVGPLHGLPAISVPCGFTKDGLPVGVQIVGRHQDDLGVLQLAYTFEQLTGFGKQKPPLVL